MQPWLDSALLAYLDPGTGSYALQLLMAGLFGGLFVLRQSWSQLKLRIAAGFGGPAQVDDPPSRPGRAELRPRLARNPRHHGQPIVERP